MNRARKQAGCLNCENTFTLEPVLELRITRSNSDVPSSSGVPKQTLRSERYDPLAYARGSRPLLQLRKS